MSNADLVVTLLIDQQVVLEGWFRVAAFDPRGEAAVGCFDVVIAILPPNPDRLTAP